jgi:two-component system LytT family response regulator
MHSKNTEINPINAIIIDNELHCIEELKRLLLDDGRVEVLAGISDSSAAVKEISTLKPELLFLDIDMPVLNGFELLRELKKINLQPFVVFVTAFPGFAIEAIKQRAFDYLLKPVDKKELSKCIDQFIESRKSHPKEPDYYTFLEQLAAPKRIRLNTSGGFVLINYSDIIYIEADWNYSRVYVSKKKCETITINLGAMEKILPSNQFARISRSFIINLQYLKRVKRLSRQCTLLKDEDEYKFHIPVNRIRILERLLEI